MKTSDYVQVWQSNDSNGRPHLFGTYEWALAFAEAEKDYAERLDSLYLEIGTDEEMAAADHGGYIDAKDWVTVEGTSQDVKDFLMTRGAEGATWSEVHSKVASKISSVEDSPLQDRIRTSSDTDWLVEEGEKAESEAEAESIDAIAHSIVKGMTVSELADATKARITAERVLTARLDCGTHAPAPAQRRIKIIGAIERIRRNEFHRVLTSTREDVY